MKITLSTNTTEGVNVYVANNKIEYFYLYDSRINNLQDLLPIAKDLKTLKLLDCDINNLDGIEEFSQLTELSLSYNLIAQDLKKILKLENLKTLNIRY